MVLPWLDGWFLLSQAARPDSCSKQPSRLASAGGSGPVLRPPTRAPCSSSSQRALSKQVPRITSSSQKLNHYQYTSGQALQLIQRMRKQAHGRTCHGSPVPRRPHSSQYSCKSLCGSALASS
nr:uncharacterized protein LOC108403920 isoform X3 [Manis javanica]